MFIFCIVLIIATGIGGAFQSSTNAVLTSYVGNYQASLISFAGGMLIFLISSLLVGTGDISLVVEAAPWQLLGGIYGAFTVLIITFAVPELGIALTLTLIMLGQLIMSAIIDGFGLFLTQQIDISFLRMAGCALTAIGIICVYIGKRKQSGEGHRRKNAKAAVLIVSAFLSGVGGAVQTPTNVSLSAITGRHEASFISFSGGVLALLIATLIVNKGHFVKMTGRGIKPWMLFGGLYGGIGIFSNIVANPVIGVVLITVCSMLGQLTGALVIDTYGLMRIPKIVMNRWRYIGIAIIAIGVIMVSLAKLQ